MMIPRYTFAAAAAPDRASYSLLSAGIPVLYGFRFASAAYSKYRLKTASAGSCYNLSHANNRGRGLWRFNLDCRCELFHEKPIHTFMYAVRDLQYSNKLFPLMYQTREIENVSLSAFLSRGLSEGFFVPCEIITEQSLTDADSDTGGHALTRVFCKYAAMTSPLMPLETLDFNTCLSSRPHILCRNEPRESPNVTGTFFGEKPRRRAEALNTLFNLISDSRNAKFSKADLMLVPLRTLKPAHYKTDETKPAQICSGTILKPNSRNAAERERENKLYCQSDTALDTVTKDADIAGDFFRAFRKKTRGAKKTSSVFSAKKAEHSIFDKLLESRFIRLFKDMNHDKFFENLFSRLSVNLRLNDTSDLSLERQENRVSAPEYDTRARRRVIKEARGGLNLPALDKTGDKDIFAPSDILFSAAPEKQAQLPWVLFYLDRDGEKPQLVLLTQKLLDCNRSLEAALSAGVRVFREREHGALSEGETEAIIDRIREACSAGQVLLSPEAAFFIAETSNVAYINRDLEADIDFERRLSLWKRLWFLAAEGDTDKIILPRRDFPYEDDPIAFSGFDDLLPDNYNVVYPETFWRGVLHHPIRGGADLGTSEIPLAINIMVEIINILILMWSRFYRAFWGWTGTQAVLGITAELLALLTLETSRAEQDDKGSRVHYDRCFRWLRWEAEKTALLARNDMLLRGNFYVGILLEEMISYMLDHHFDVMPVFQDIEHMDNWRRLFGSDLQNDIAWTLDKVKGIRHKLIEGGKI